VGSRCDARRYLHELWLRELECWCIDAQGREVRLDDGYQPERIVPEWVERVEGRAARVAPPQVQLSLGLANLLADPEGDLPGDWNRDELLFHILDWMGQETRPAGYEVREVLGAHLSRLVKKAGETGDLVVRAFDDVGGAMAADQAAPLLARARAVRPQVELPFDPERLGLSLPAIIVPDPYPRQQPIKFGQGHPLDGVIVHQVSDVLARVRPGLSQRLHRPWLFFRGATRASMWAAAPWHGTSRTSAYTKCLSRCTLLNMVWSWSCIGPLGG
jgi:hypothetical protein